MRSRPVFIGFGGFGKESARWRKRRGVKRWHVTIFSSWFSKASRFGVRGSRKQERNLKYVNAASYRH